MGYLESRIGLVLQLDVKIEAGDLPEALMKTVPPKVAVLIPCYNEEVTIADTVTAFHAQLPTAVIYVFTGRLQGYSDNIIRLSYIAAAGAIAL